MTDLRKAAERLLEALDDGWVQRDDWVAISLRQALQRPVKSYTNNSPQYATDDMYTKPQNVYTSEERVHEIDISIHEDDDIQEYKKPWVGLSAGEVEIYGNQFNGIQLVKEIEGILKERNT